MGNFTNLATTDLLIADTINDVLDELDGAISPPTAVLTVPVVAGEALAANQVVYISTGTGGGTAGRAYKANATNAYSSIDGFVIGCVMEAIGAGATGSIMLVGVATMTGLTPGAIYYVSTTAGELTATPPTNAVIVGIALSATQLLLNNRGAQRAIS